MIDIRAMNPRDRDAARAIFIAAAGPDVVGFVSVDEEAHWTGELDAYIGELVVHPEHERQGIGRQLVQAAEEWAMARGLRRVRLSTGAANRAALQLHDDLGYRIEDVSLSKSVAAVDDSAG